MSSNTHASDINELHLTFLSNGSTWLDSADAEVYTHKRSLCLAAEVSAQVGRAYRMHEALVSYLRPVDISRAWWVSRPGVLQAIVANVAMGTLVTGKHPADVLLQLSNTALFGVSCKSGKRAGLPFKNPGLGTMDRVLSMELAHWVHEAEHTIVEAYGLPVGLDARKAAIRDSPAIASATRAMGLHLLQVMRDALLARLQAMSVAGLRQHLLQEWLDASADVYPPYVRVTAFGTKAPLPPAIVEHPRESPTMQVLMRATRFTLLPIATNTIGVIADDTPVMRMRVKFESEKLASCVKFSADPWKPKTLPTPLNTQPCGHCSAS